MAMSKMFLIYDRDNGPSLNEVLVDYTGYSYEGVIVERDYSVLGKIINFFDKRYMPRENLSVKMFHEGYGFIKLVIPKDRLIKKSYVLIGKEDENYSGEKTGIRINCICARPCVETDDSDLENKTNFNGSWTK